MFEASNDYVKLIRYIRILSINENELHVKMHTYGLKIQGEGLYISYYDKFEIQVNGHITKIEYEYA